MSEVLIDINVIARSQMANKLLEAADELGLSRGVIKTTSEGFRVPTEVHRHLFPSIYEDRDEGDSDPVVTLHGDASTELDDQGDGSDPAADFTEPEQDKYDAMEFQELRDAAKDRDINAGGSADEIRARLREADQS